jgi:hypothetical protein
VQRTAGSRCSPRPLGVSVRRMHPVKIFARPAGLVLLLSGIVGTAVALLSIFDPVASKMADDGDPFGTPPSLFSSLVILFIYLCLCGPGAFLT